MDAADIKRHFIIPYGSSAALAILLSANDTNLCYRFLSMSALILLPMVRKVADVKNGEPLGVRGDRYDYNSQL